ncbi:MAG: hypothetical protein AAFV38_06210 [Pseudomonadota bacterium]
MAGYIARKFNWRRFEKHSGRLFERYGVRVFHAMDLHGTKRDFKGWPRDRKIEFLQAWANIAANEEVTGVSVTINRQDYNETRQREEVNENISPLHQCFIVLLQQLYGSEEGELWSLVEGQKISILMEESEKLSGIEKWYEHKRALPSAGGKLKTMRQISKGHCRAIQYADAFAFLSRRQAHDHDRAGSYERSPEFGALLRTHPHHGGIIGSFGRSDVPADQLQATWTASR